MNTLTMIFVSIAILVVYAIGVIYFRRRRAWLGYYLFAALGLVLIIVFGARMTGLADKIEYGISWMTAWASSFFGMHTQFLGQNELMVADRNGWVTLQTTIECSALIESSVLLGLILFYPAFSAWMKARIITIGLLVTGVANMTRLLIITGMTAAFGRQAVFFGHAIVGRLFFLTVMVVLYWYILTMPTIRQVGLNVEATEASL